MKSKKAFTLIELLVVVLIIGILAAIAVPQYQLAVGKSKFSTLKDTTRALVNAEEVYYLQNGYYAPVFTALDVAKPSNINCSIWATTGDQNAIACYIRLQNKEIRYYYFMSNTKNKDRKSKQACYAMTTDKNHLVNKICQQETKKEGDCSSGSYCTYIY